jgi:hypothetical protein
MWNHQLTESGKLALVTRVTCWAVPQRWPHVVGGRLLLLVVFIGCDGQARPFSSWFPSDVCLNDPVPFGGRRNWIKMSVQRERQFGFPRIMAFQGCRYIQLLLKKNNKNKKNKKKSMPSFALPRYENYSKFPESPLQTTLVGCTPLAEAKGSPPSSSPASA